MDEHLATRIALHDSAWLFNSEVIGPTLSLLLLIRNHFLGPPQTCHLSLAPSFALSFANPVFSQVVLRGQQGTLVGVLAVKGVGMEDQDHSAALAMDGVLEAGLAAEPGRQVHGQAGGEPMDAPQAHGPVG